MNEETAPDHDHHWREVARAERTERQRTRDLLVDVMAERDEARATLDRVRALCEIQWCHHECSTAARIRAALVGGRET